MRDTKEKKRRVACRIKTGDEVQVIRGAESGRRTAPPEGDEGGNPRGLRGRVRSVLRSEGRVVVQGVRMVKKATRPDPRKGHRGGFLELEAAIPISNVMLVCRKCDMPVRVRIEERAGEGEDSKKKRVRVCRKCGEPL